MAIDHEIVVVTPELAESLLSRNSKNRPLNERRVTALVKAIERGEWELNGDSIRLSESGVLLDGQHRLAAIVESGISVETIIVRGLKDSVFDVIDRGAARSVGDILSIKGEKNYNALAAVARLYYMWSVTGNPFHGNPDMVPTARQIEAVIEDNPGLRSSTSIAISSSWIRKNMTAKIAGFCFYVFASSDMGYALESFYTVLDTGVATRKNDPAIALRDMLMEDRASGNKRRMTSQYKCALVFKAFKKHAVGETVRFLRVRTEGDSRETNIFAAPTRSNA